MATNSSLERLIVKLNPTASSSAVTKLKEEIGVTKVTTASQLGIDIWEIPSEKVEKIISAYKYDPRFAYIERDQRITLDDVQTTSPTQQNLATITPQANTPNDPGYPQLWGLNNTGQSGGTPDADIDAPEAWDIKTGNPHLLIGVIDSGVDYTHPDLAPNIWTNPGEIAGNGIDDDGNGYIDDVHGWDFFEDDDDPMDVQGHGTHVAGTIAAKGNNGVGVTGVVWDAKIVIIRFLGDDGSGLLSDAILGINYAKDNNIKLTNNSWGGGSYSQALYDAIEQYGGLFIAAAGNSSLNNDLPPFPLPIIPFPAYPASYDLDNIISVAATDHKDKYSSFTNYGRTSVDLAAPGSAIYSTKLGGTYETLSGTSMASPHVTGVAALVWSQYPDWTAQEVKNRLMETTDPISDELTPGLPQRPLRKTVTNGRVNAHKALGGSTSTVKGEAAEDPLTGGMGEDSLMLPFPQSSVSATAPVTDFGSEIIDFLTEGGAMMNAASLLNPAVNSAVPTLENDVMPVFTAANGALAGNPALKINSEPLRVAKAGWMADIYPGFYDAKPFGIEVA